MTNHTSEIRAFLDNLVARYETPAFIDRDPISVPHAFDDPRDQEIIGLYAALLAWGRRETILAKMADLCRRMEYRPYHFVLNFDESRDGGTLADFVHRTFQPEDAIWLTKALSAALQKHRTVERLFLEGMDSADGHVGNAIEGFSKALLSVLPDTPRRLRKHLARPSTGSACKRLCMYLRWMVRPGPVDLGHWKNISPAQLVLPLDVHCGTQARKWGMLARSTDDWRAAMELTEACRKLSADDPARYDFAFFGFGAYGELPGDSADARGPSEATVSPTVR